MASCVFQDSQGKRRNVRAITVESMTCLETTLFMAPFFGTHIAIENTQPPSQFRACQLPWCPVFWLCSEVILFPFSIATFTGGYPQNGRGDIFQHAKVPCARLWGSDDSKNCTVFLFTAAPRYPGGACHHGHRFRWTRVKTHRFFTCLVIGSVQSAQRKSLLQRLCSPTYLTEPPMTWSCLVRKFWY